MRASTHDIVGQELLTPAIAEFCMRWKITELALFGSALRPDFQHGSDVDLLVTFSDDANWSLLDHIAMQNRNSKSGRRYR